jgi:hypothetical protein
MGYCFIVLALLITGLTAIGQDKKDSGQHKKLEFVLFREATSQDVGLPVYPGARVQKDSDDGPAFQIIGSRLKLVVLKLESDDSPEKVSSFYRKALSKYGPVLECSGSSEKTSDQSKDRASNKLDCDSGHLEKAGLTLKAGSKRKQHAVRIQANGSYTRFELHYVETPKSD